MFNPLLSISLILLLAFLILFLRLILRAFNIRNLGLSFALGHFIFILLLIGLSYLGEKGFTLYFFITVLDFPSSLLFGIARPYILELTSNSQFSYELFPFIFCSIFGSFQYYFIGKAIEYSNNKRLKVSLQR